VSASGDPAVRILMQTGVLKAFIQIVSDKKTVENVSGFRSQIISQCSE